MQTIELIQAIQSLREMFLKRNDYDLAAQCKVKIEKLIESLEIQS